MKSPRLVSIVTPSYNKGAYVEATIQSVLSQTHANVEYIVMDGGSTDGTLDIVRRYEDRLRWISEPDKGQADAINKGWRMCTGEILAYLNADDTYFPWTVQTVVDFFAANPDVDMVYGHCQFIDDKGAGLRTVPTGDFDLPSLITGPNTVPQPTVFFRRKVLDDTGYLNVNLHMGLDYDFAIRVAIKHRVRFLPRLLATYRLCAGTKTVSNFPAFGPDVLAIMKGLYAQPDLPPDVARVRSAAFRNAYFMNGLYWWETGQIGKARSDFLKALRLDPVGAAKTKLFILYLATSFLGTRATRVLIRAKRGLQRLPNNAIGATAFGETESQA